MVRMEEEEVIWGVSWDFPLKNGQHEIGRMPKRTRPQDACAREDASQIPAPSGGPALSCCEPIMTIGNQWSWLTAPWYR
jgi:hypothetical protein